MRYAQDPPNLILPTLATIEHIARREGLGELSALELDFIWDLLAKTGGAQVAEFNEEEAQLEAAVHAIQEAEAFMLQHPGINQTVVTRRFERDYHEVQHQLHHLLERLDLTQIPGYNHPTKAVRVVKLVRRLTQLWVLYMIEVAEIYGFLRLIQEAIKRVKSLSPSDLALLQEFAPATSDNSELDAELLGLELQLSNMDLGEVLRIARYLDELSEFQRGRAKPTPDPNGEEVRLRDNHDISELGKAGQSAYALPPRLRMKRAAMNELGVREPQTRRDQKQLLFLVVDGTGSMLEDGATSASRAAGVLINRLRAVIDNDAEVYVRFFDGDLRHKEYHAKDADSARELMRIVSDPDQYTGSVTHFDTTLETASRRVKELMARKSLREPELVFVTDGHGVVPDVSVLQGIKMHVVQVGSQEVEELSQLARLSGGINVNATLAVQM